MKPNLILLVLLISIYACSDSDSDSESDPTDDQVVILSPENAILEFNISTIVQDIPAEIDGTDNTITKRLPPGVDLTQLETSVTISPLASISPDPSTVTDYSSPVDFTVTAENGQESSYTVSFETMSEAVNISCEENNATKWFGGDIRDDDPDPTINFAPRNVGTGQGYIPPNDLNPTSFSVRLDSGFFIADGSFSTFYVGGVELRLNIRTADGTTIATLDKTVANLPDLNWVEFELTNLNLLLENDETYFFTWYLVNGEELGIVTGSNGNTEPYSGPCDGLGLSGQSANADETSLEDWNVWFEHPWHFNFRLEGWE